MIPCFILSQSIFTKYLHEYVLYIIPTSTFVYSVAFDVGKFMLAKFHLDTLKLITSYNVCMCRNYAFIRVKFLIFDEDPRHNFPLLFEREMF